MPALGPGPEDRFKDRYAGKVAGWSSSLTRFAVDNPSGIRIPSNTVDLPFVPRGIKVGVAGNLAVIPIDATDDTDIVIIPSLTNNVFHAIRCRRIMATGTTASSICIGD